MPIEAELIKKLRRFVLSTHQRTISHSMKINTRESPNEPCRWSALAIFAEKTLSWVRPVTRTTVAVLVAYGAMVLATPQILPTFMVDGYTSKTAPADMQNMPMPGNVSAPLAK
jgi:hypothetical protein